jgi:DNA topoisomerase-3
MDKTGGLGTPATRADIIEKLFSSFYIEKRGKEIHPTSKGIQLVEMVPSDLRSPELTAKWEQKLNLISSGKANPLEFINDMKNYATKLISAVIASSDVYRHDNMTHEKCPECGKYLLEVNSKKGKMLVCQDRECGYRKGLSIVSNARCPECHKKMEVRGEGSKKAFFCACGYRETLEAFNKRKGEHINKKEVGRFLSRQQDEGINSALADALAKWKK